VANAAGPEVLTAYVQDGHSMCITHDMRYSIHSIPSMNQIHFLVLCTSLHYVSLKTQIDSVCEDVLFQQGEACVSRRLSTFRRLQSSLRADYAVGSVEILLVAAFVLLVRTVFLALFHSHKASSILSGSYVTYFLPDSSTSGIHETHIMFDRSHPAKLLAR
jgi:hypothetical protein